MVAYQGNVDFAFEGGGASKFIKKALTGEGLPLMRCQGQGDVFLAERAYDVHLLNLNNSGLSISGKNVLAFSSSLDWNIERVKGGSMATGGLFNTTLRGTGWVALTTDGPPVVLNAAEAPTFADTNAVVAWSANLQTQLKTSFKAGALIGRGSGEAVQVSFYGQGFVIVQPSEGIQITATAVGHSSSSTVTGPSLTSSTCHVRAEHAGLDVGAERRSASAKAVTSGSATAPGAAAFHVGRRPLAVLAYSVNWLTTRIGASTSLADFSSSRILSCQSFSASRCALRGVVVVGDTDQREQPLAVRLDGADDLAVHRHRRRRDPLHEDAHDRDAATATLQRREPRIRFMVSISRCWVVTIALGQIDLQRWNCPSVDLGLRHRDCTLVMGDHAGQEQPARRRRPAPFFRAVICCRSSCPSAAVIRRPCRGLRASDGIGGVPHWVSQLLHLRDLGGLRGLDLSRPAR